MHKVELCVDDQRENSTLHVEEVHSTTASYAFSLRRLTRDRVWSLAGVNDATETERDQSFVQRVGQFVFAPECIDEYLARDVVSSDGFEITSVSPVDRGAQRLLKLEFKLKPSTRVFFDSGWVVVSPTDGWRTVESECYRPGRKDRPFHRVVEYERTPDGIDVARRVTVTHPKNTYVSVFELAMLESANLSEADFKLGAYGLPEIDRTGGKRRAEGMVYWLLSLGVGALFLSWCLRRVSMRIREAPA